jgi:exopolyphosphatase/guanosine-5'-triphosphate,3'-diphosphate pyrophosphatase
MYACIDLGSNSFHLLIAEWQNGSSQIVERFSDIVQLGEGVTQSGEISPAAFERGLLCLEQFADVMSRYPIKRYWALGTNALRLARNAQDFIEKARLMGIDISVVSGTQEAILVYLGVLSGLPSSDMTRFIVDIGGGSTEIIIGSQDSRFLTLSLPIGCVSWRDKYFGELPANQLELEHSLDRATSEATLVFQGVRDRCLDFPWIESYASSGTAKMFATISQQLGYEEEGISLTALESMKPEILACAADPQLLLPGLKDRRKDLLLPGWAVLVGMMRTFSMTRILFSPTALREGMLHFMMQKGADTAMLGKDTLPDITHTEL